jgi:hypothetical protein
MKDQRSTIKGVEEVTDVTNPPFFLPEIQVNIHVLKKPSPVQPPSTQSVPKPRILQYRKTPARTSTAALNVATPIPPTQPFHAYPLLLLILTLTLPPIPIPTHSLLPLPLASKNPPS